MLYAVSRILEEHPCLLEKQLPTVDCFTIGHDDLFTRQLHVVTKEVLYLPYRRMRVYMISWSQSSCPIVKNSLQLIC